MGNKIADKIMKPKPIIDVNSRNVEEIIFFFFSEKRKIEKKDFFEKEKKY